jgi:hypothetical protein
MVFNLGVNEGAKLNVQSNIQTPAPVTTVTPTLVSQAPAVVQPVTVISTLTFTDSENVYVNGLYEIETGTGQWLVCPDWSTYNSIIPGNTYTATLSTTAGSLPVITGYYVVGQVPYFYQYQQPVIYSFNIGNHIPPNPIVLLRNSIVPNWYPIYHRLWRR